MENELSHYTDADLFRLAGVTQYPEACSVVELDSASTRELQADYGMTRRQSQKAKAIMELAKRWLRGTTTRGACISNSAQVFDVLYPHVAHVKQELFLLGLLDAKHHLLDVIEISRGSLTSSLVHPREVFRPAVKQSAAAVLVAHNHPSGDPKPSREDRALTERLIDAGEHLGIQILDHLIIGEGRYISFADEGWMRPSHVAR